MTTQRLLSFLVPLAFAAGCVHAPTVSMVNPLGGGSLGDNEIKYRDRANESDLGLPAGTLEHDASLVVADERELCFKVKLRTARKDLSQLKNWRVFLRGKPTFEDMSPAFKSAERVTGESMMGSVAVQSHASQRVCDNSGYCINKTVTTTSQEPKTINVLSGGGTVCFANAGHLNKATEEITLHLDDPSPGGGMFGSLMNRVAFRWKFH